PARRPCVLYSVTGSNAQARDKLHGLVWLRSDFTVLVRLKHTSSGAKKYRRRSCRAANTSATGFDMSPA
ncbi:hypothetical protein, partial [Burkholderia multivorans]|uniref:hypothetical protein n=2 Tax=Burkholderia multivorans TaxID=87883 RepID=UPI0020A22E9C